jgi:hypothetical protein
MATRSSASKKLRIKNPRWIHTCTQMPYPVMLVIGREAAAERALFVDRANSRKFPDVHWMEISSPEQIKQIEFVGETIDVASVLQWKRKMLAAGPATP